MKKKRRPAANAAQASATNETLAAPAAPEITAVVEADELGNDNNVAAAPQAETVPAQAADSAAPSGHESLDASFDAQDWDSSTINRFFARGDAFESEPNHEARAEAFAALEESSRTTQVPPRPWFLDADARIAGLPVRQAAVLSFGVAFFLAGLWLLIH
jgi:hypothetical protein